MFGLMRKLISKPFADTPEKRDQMDKLVCDMVDGIPMQPTEAIYLDSVTGPKTAKGTINYGDYPPIDYGDVEKPVWRQCFDRELPEDTVSVFYLDDQSFAFFGEVAKRIECRECWGGGKEVQTRTTTFSDHWWVTTNTTYTGAKCQHCKGKGYTLERFKQ